MRVFISWSGGKDSCLALFKALKAGFDIACLLCMLDENGLRSRSHGLTREILDAQANALGIPIIYGKASWNNYEEKFKEILVKLRSMGVEGGVFGDLRIQGHKNWVERVCSEVGVKAFEPLWGENCKRLIDDFLSEGFKAIIVNVDAGLIDEDWVGRLFDYNFIDYLERKGLDLCGENGEYHTLVTYGPIFKKTLEILEAKRTRSGRRCLLEITKISLTP